MAAQLTEAVVEARSKTLQSIGSGQVPALKHIDSSNDRSAPKIEDGLKINTWDKEGFLHEIEAGKNLHHVTTDDRSSPKIEEGLHVQPSHHKDVLTEVKAEASRRETVRLIKSMSGNVKLHHVETIDKSKPVIGDDVHIQKWDKEGFLHEIESTPHLKHVNAEEIHDHSSPIIEPGVHVVKDNSHEKLVEQIQGFGSGTVGSPLKHVAPEQVHDASAPVLPKRCSVIADAQ